MFVLRVFVLRETETECLFVVDAFRGSLCLVKGRPFNKSDFAKDLGFDAVTFRGVTTK